MDLTPTKEMAAEFIGAFMLVFAGCGAIMIDVLTGAFVYRAICRR